MSTLTSSHQKRSLKRSYIVISFSAIFIAVLVVITTLSAAAQPHQAAAPQAGGSFKFTAAGDYGQNNYTTANLKYIAQSGASFDLALGDFNYNPSVSDAQWSAYAKGLLPANFPFEILFGDHDGSGGKTYTTNFPNRMANMSGTYAKQYYFDYPASSPLARFIMISPDGDSKGSSGYNWVANAITSARSANIHWIIVGMYNYCFTLDQSCNNQDLLDLLLNMHVDLILQAHKHSYQASKQLALNANCKSLSTTYNSQCVVNSSTSMTRGAGSVIVVTGTGGATPQISINPKESQMGYFRTWAAANKNETWGISQFTVSATQISMRFVNTTGSFTDSFTING